jgi:acyl carrier protein phosphodiesterase
MNFLAHALLADDSAESLIGNLAPDFLSNDYAPAHPEILAGMKRHRFVDEFVDCHPAFLRSRALFSKQFRHAAGIIVDVAYDHILAKSWQNYSTQPLPVFVSCVYAKLETRVALSPPMLQEALPRMIGQNWLGSYGTINGIRLTFTRMSTRLKRDIGLPGAADVLAFHCDEIERDFTEVFRDLSAAIKKS